MTAAYKPNECRRLFRLQSDSRVDVIHAHAASSRAGRELAMETMERDRNAALAAVRCRDFSVCWPIFIFIFYIFKQQ